MGQRDGEARLRPAALHRGIGGPRRLDRPRRLRQGLRRPARLRLVRARHESRRRAPAHRDHRVHQRRDDRRARDRQPRGRSVHVVQRLLGRVLDLRLVQLPQVRRDAPLQPARAGLRAQGRQGALGRRSLGTRDGRGLAHPLRHLRAGRHPALPRGQGHRPASVGVQRGAGRARRRACDRRADRRAPPHPSRHRASRPRDARHAEPLRGCARRLRAPALPHRPPCHGHRVRPGHDLHSEPRQGPPRARRARPQREGRRGDQPAALPDAAARATARA